jgi:integrase
MKGVYQRKDRKGIWCISYYVDGRQKRESIGPSKKLAETVLSKRKTEIAEGKFLDKSKIKRIKLMDFVTLFLDTYSKPNKSSWKDDVQRLTAAADILGKGKHLDEIKPYDIEDFKKYKLQEGIEPSTVNRYLTIMKTMFKKAIEWGYAEKNPLDTIKHLRENNVKVRYLEKEEIARLLEVCSPYLKAAVLTALNTGMRKGEMMMLKWSDIDFKNSIIYVHKTKNNEPKMCPMNIVVKRELINLREHSEKEQVFPMNVDKIFSKAIRCAKITHCRWHDLRHTFASHLVMNGVDLMTVKELMGHKDIKMTMRYSHLSQGHKARSVDTLGSMMESIISTKQAPQGSLEILEKQLLFVSSSD